MGEITIKEIIKFANKWETDYQAGICNYTDIITAKIYQKYLRKNQETSAYNKALMEKLNIIISESTLYHSDIFHLFNSTTSIAEYVICLIKEKHLIDPKLIARCAYIEICKYLYYDISVTKTEDEKTKKIIVGTPINPRTAKIFSYVVCSQWLQLYQYILLNFGIKVKKMNREGENHVWGEVILDNDEIIIVDGTDYIMSSIDLSNAKSLSPTKGFLVLPKKYSGLKFQEVFTKKEYHNLLDEIKKYYEENRELDKTLGYIKDKKYPIETILEESELFNRGTSSINNLKEASKFLTQVQRFFASIDIPNNMDGYEAFAYYHMFIMHLPPNIRGNIAMRTIYVDTFLYKQARLRRKYLKTDEEYLKYLKELVYARYYSYLNESKDTDIFADLKSGKKSAEEVSEEILKQELKIADINKRLNPYYAINELTIYNPFNDSDDDFYQLYEPSIGKKTFKSQEKLLEYKKLTKII